MFRSATPWRPPSGFDTPPLFPCVASATPRAYYFCFSVNM
jgi:hypothetical protein